MNLEEEEVLCCCEYINNKSEKTHLLAICCDCQEFDLCFTRCITCSKSRGIIGKMLLTFQDRLRIPWRGGAKQVQFGAIAPAVALPIAIAFAAINIFVTIIVFLANFAFLFYAYYYVRSRKVRTNFFAVWLVWSVVCMVVLFQFTVPLLEILPEENLVLVLLTGGAVLCLYRTFKRAALNQVVHNDAEKLAEDSDAATTLLIEPDTNDVNNKNEPNACKRCSKETFITANHCDVCAHCVLHRRHHSFWLNCCIGAANYKHYFIGLILSELSLLLGSNLTLTAICHPVLIQRIGGISIMLPDDCSEVYDDYSFSVAFVIAVYALVIAFFVLLECARQVFALLGKQFWQNNAQNNLRQRKPSWAEAHTFTAYVK